MEWVYCIACQYGAHEDHHKVIETPPPGMLGGRSCPCKGECVERRRPLALSDASPGEQP